LENSFARLDPFRASPATRNLDDLPPALLERLGAETGRIGLIVQRNAEGVIVSSLDQALVKHADRLKDRLGSLIAPDYDGYAAMGAMLRSGGAFVYVPDGV